LERIRYYHSSVGGSVGKVHADADTHPTSSPLAKNPSAKEPKDGGTQKAQQKAHQSSCKLKRLQGGGSTTQSPAYYGKAAKALQQVGKKYGVVLEHRTIRGIETGSDGTVGSNIVSVSRNGKSLGSFVVAGDLTNNSKVNHAEVIEGAMRRQIPADKLGKACDTPAPSGDFELHIDPKAQDVLQNNRHAVMNGVLMKQEKTDSGIKWVDLINLRGEEGSYNQKVEISATQNPKVIRMDAVEVGGKHITAFYHVTKGTLTPTLPAP
jgi:hypothetical protein